MICPKCRKRTVAIEWMEPGAQLRTCQTCSFAWVIRNQPLEPLVFEELQQRLDLWV